MKKSIGIDISMDTLDVALYDGNTHMNKQFENNESGFKKIECEILNNNQSGKLISMEATGVYHLQATKYFHVRNYKISIVNPLIIKRYSEMKMLRAKTDPVDARTIAEYGFYEKPYFYVKKDNKREQIIQLLKQIDSLNGMKSKNNNRIHALNKIPEADETALAIYMELKKFLGDKIKQSEKRIKEIIKEFYFEEAEKLITIPGVGNRVSSLIIGFFGQFENFENAKQVVSFIGFSPSVKQSGISVKGRGTISKKGNAYIRKIFVSVKLTPSSQTK